MLGGIRSGHVTGLIFSNVVQFTNTAPNDSTDHNGAAGTSDGPRIMFDAGLGHVRDEACE